MRNNQPVTGREVEVREGQIIVSRTNDRGVITFVNRDFIAISGFSEVELVGQPHNVVRHPDMPAELFADFWNKLKAGRPWTGLVKNRCKNGDHYWVHAHATPIFDDGKITGYMSVRRRASREQIADAERMYADIRNGRRRSFEVVNGAVVATRIDRKLNPLWKLGLGARLTMFGLSGVGLATLILVLLDAGHDVSTLWKLIAATALFVIYSAWWLKRDVVDRLNEASRIFRQVANNQFEDPIDIDRNDEVGSVLLGLKSMQIRLGFQVQEIQRQRDEMARVQSGLDVAAANMMVTDPELNVVYTNSSLLTSMRAAEANIRRDLAGFSVAGLIGSNLDPFLPFASLSRQALLLAQGTQRASMRVGGHSFDLAITPVRNDKGVTLGFAVEWRDRTAELLIENEVASVVQAAAEGDFSQRIALEGKQGFMRTVAEGVDRVLETTAGGLGDIQQILGAIAEGDLTRRITRNYRGIFGDMKDSTNQTADKLSEIIGDIQVASDTITTAASEIASGNSDLSQRTEQQAATLEEAAASVEELNSTVKKNTENSRLARQLASGAAQVASRGGAVVSEAVASMEAIAGFSRKIEDIIGVIDGIAFQTNILALNAAVEAARAGEQGRGFAVVASEVRALAQRSAGAAKEIKALIAESSQTVGQGSERVGDAGRTMSEIVGAVQRVSDLIGDIATASEEQSNGIDQVHQTVMQMDQVTQQNAALVEEAAAAAHAMNQQAQVLGQSVAAFRLR